MPEKVPTEQHVREFTRSCVRSGLLSDQELYDEVLLAVTTELPSEPAPAQRTRDWIEEFRAELAADEATWPEVTDYDRIQSALSELAASDVVVLQGCDDHWAAKAVLDTRSAAGTPPRGIAWFTPSDVWHAIDEGMLEVNLWHGTTANVAPGDLLLDDVVAVFERHGLPAHFDEGRIEVSAHWQRRRIRLTRD
ncbi:MAG TPA: hypothetical protein VFG63_04960 [Nocardioidaceae bacterium]|nr:hypothetical protein [Nocardioidaceae bacterium]